MLVSPEFARWIVRGVDPKGGPPDARSEPDRFAEYERTVMNRTNGFRAAHDWRQWNIPWPHAVGTPPWGAKRELEYGAARRGAAYAMRLVRLGSSDALRDVHRDLVRLVREGLPALLYVGDGWLPRHVTLVLPGTGVVGDTGVLGDTRVPSAAGLVGDTGLDVYDPATGLVTELAQERFASRSLEIAGWNVPWITVQPRPH
jgi:hypothetical protein